MSLIDQLNRLILLSPRNNIASRVCKIINAVLYRSTKPATTCERLNSPKVRITNRSNHPTNSHVLMNRTFIIMTQRDRPFQSQRRALERGTCRWKVRPWKTNIILPDFIVDRSPIGRDDRRRRRRGACRGAITCHGTRHVTSRVLTIRKRIRKRLKNERRASCSSRNSFGVPVHAFIHPFLRRRVFLLEKGCSCSSCFLENPFTDLSISRHREDETVLSPSGILCISYCIELVLSPLTPPTVEGEMDESEGKGKGKKRSFVGPFVVHMALSPRLEATSRLRIRDLHGIDFFLETLEFDLTRSTAAAADPEVAARSRGPRDARLSCHGDEWSFPKAE